MMEDVLIVSYDAQVDTGYTINAGAKQARAREH